MKLSPKEFDRLTEEMACHFTALTLSGEKGGGERYRQELNMAKACLKIDKNIWQPTMADVLIILNYLGYDIVKKESE